MSKSISIGLVGLLVLASVAIVAPPDGQERAAVAQLFGSLHPLAVHLPIALLLLVPVLEIVGRQPARSHLRVASDFVLGLAVLSAFAAPALGWLLAWSGGYEGGLVIQHMWGGIAVAAGSLLCWIFRIRATAGADSSRAGSRLPGSYGAMLLITIGVLAWTGYRGGQLAHGENHLTEHFPLGLKARLGLSSEGAVSNAQSSTFYGARIAPIFETHCLICHGANKRKGGLRLDSYEQLVRGGKNGAVVKVGDAAASDLYRRVSLDRAHKDFMPAEGKPPLSDADRKLIELWIEAGASSTLGVNAIAGVLDMAPPAEPLAPDYTPDVQAIRDLQVPLGIRLVPRSQNARDGLILRTASSPAICDDAVLAKLAPVAGYVVEAELARTRVTDAGLKALAAFTSLRTLDLSHTTITSAGVRELITLPKLETLNLTATAVDDAGAHLLRKRESLKRVYLFHSRVTTPDD